MTFDDLVATTRFGMLCKRTVSRLELRLLEYYKRNPLEREGVRVVREIYAREASIFSILLGRSKPVLFSPYELLNIWEQVRILRNHGGALAEVGAFMGDSAEVACKAKGDRLFYVFEAFSGLPSGHAMERRFRPGAFASAENALRNRLERYPNTVVVPGYFPATSECVRDRTFSYVHLDVDLYQSTLDALAFFYPRMLRGGRIVSHDYGHCVGVWQAFDEFFADKPEPIQPMSVSQVMITKI